MRVMSPKRDLGDLAHTFEIRNEIFQSLNHMGVAFIPGFDMAAKHRAIVLFSIFYEPCILLGEEKLILRNASIAACILRGFPSQFDQLFQYLVFTRFR